MAIDQTMQYWTRGGSLDSIILGIFLQAMADGKIGKKQIHTDQDTQISPYREALYAPYVQSWTTIMDDIDNIEKQYLQYRTSEDIGEQSRLALTIKDLQFHLIEVADLMKVVFVTLHGQTPSDLIP